MREAIPGLQAAGTDVATLAGLVAAMPSSAGVPLGEMLHPDAIEATAAGWLELDDSLGGSATLLSHGRDFDGAAFDLGHETWDIGFTLSPNGTFQGTRTTAESTEPLAGRFSAGAELGFLLVHVTADGRARDAANAGPEEGGDARVGPGRRTDDGACDGARTRTDQAAARGVRELLLARVRVDGAARGKRQRCDGRDEETGSHELTPKRNFRPFWSENAAAW